MYRPWCIPAHGLAARRWPSSAQAGHGAGLAALILVDARGAWLAALGWRVSAGVQAGLDSLAEIKKGTV